MSICRYSSMDFQCDAYLYECEPNGFSLNVACKRRVYKEPLPPEVADDDFVGWVERSVKIMQMEHTLVDIGLPYDGQSFSIDTAEELLSLVDELERVGYNAPYEHIRAYVNEWYTNQPSGEVQ